METFEDLIATQQDIAVRIEAILKNFKKDSSSRKTITYIKERINRLDDAWSEFESTDNKIRCLTNLPMQHEYFIDHYLRTSDLTLKIREMFEAEIRKMESSEKMQSPTATPRKECRFATASGIQEGKDVILEHHIDEMIVKVLRNQRALMRALRRNIDEIRAQANQDNPESYYHIKAALIDKYMNDLTVNNDVLWQSTNGDDIEGYTLDDFYKLESEAHNILSGLQQHISSADVNAPQSTSRNEPLQLQLPKIELPKFYGSYMQWVAFKDLYIQLIHNTTLSDVQKMFHLTTHLGDEPKNLIKHLPITGANYGVAWNILVNRYDNRRLIVTTLLNNLLSQPKIKNETAQSLKSLHDVTKECIHGLGAQGLPVGEWDVIIVHLLLQKLDQSTQTIFEQSLNDNKKLVTLRELLRFLEHRFQALETRGRALEYPSPGGKDRTRTTATISTSSNCKVCGVTEHPIYYCEKFLKMSPAERLQWTQRNRLCVNCFKPNHTAKACSSRSCTKCTGKHNTLLHLETSSKRPNSAAKSTSVRSKQPQDSNSNAPIVATANKHQHHENYILLATAKVKVIGNNGRIGEFRALLDSGSQVNLVTERVIAKLSLQPSDSSLCIEGIGRKTKNVAQRVNFELRAHTGSYSTRVEAFVLPNIVSPQPTQTVDTSNWSLPENIKLADPRFNETDKIDILIGAEFYHQLLLPQQIQINKELPTLHNTALGWIVTGKIEGFGNKLATCAMFSPDEETTNQLIEKFWKLEDTNDSEHQMSLIEQRCETHFIQNVRRNTDGRFVVRLPFSENPIALGNSKQVSFNRFLSLERRLNSNPKLRADYNKFMEEYEALGHMEEIKENEIPDLSYFMPHHCVLKPESSTTKLRVVFDASAKTTSGLSLNDILHAGPTVQSDLFSILLRFRMHRFVFTADIEKMYRQIVVNECDQMFQIIIWRYNQGENIKFYRLKTVTYGTSPAPYLATKCLQYLASQCLTKYPLGATILRDDFYVDDCLSGTDSINTALESQSQVQTLLREAGFKLRKWCSNTSQLLSGIPPEDQEINLDFDESSNQSIKTLGMIWLPKSDQLCGRAQISSSSKITKRIVSSELARIFDPLGIFGPVVVRAKIFLQQLWQLQISWDDELPINLQHEWNNFRANIVALNNIRVDRFVFKPQTIVSTQIHTFVDASERAYGAAVYIRSTYADKTVGTRLICSKSRIAPLKKQTLPRLELCAAVLGVELTNRVKRDIRLQNTETFLWTDSQIVLAWICSTAASFHTFVANRIAKIQELSIPSQWRHVSSKENPADAISRGLAPENLSKHSIWFYGPLFLSGKSNQWSEPYSQDMSNTCDLERKETKRVLAISVTHQSLEETIFKINHRNSFRFLQRTVGYLLRFIRNSRTTRQLRPSYKALDIHEMDDALKIIIKVIQAATFSEELEKLLKQLPINKSSSVASLNPFLDEHQIMRIGGRLEQSSLPFEEKHPAILPHTHLMVKLMLQMLHENNRHCGPQALLAASRAQFWITNGKTITRSIVHKCVRCTRAKPRLFKQLMGNLPAARITPARPFITSGVDYFGPVWIHHKIRGKRPDKAYIAVFCCFATKAIHMEVVSNLSTDAFIGALRRFISRRGHCKTLYCDNATNFVGASNKLAELKESIYSQTAQEKLIRTCSEQSIEFKFIPPRAPHFGGLWEAAVKSAKHLLVRSISAASLTYEELETVIVEIEAILNSRPLIPISSNCDDLEALTPGHFLVGEPLTTTVDANAQKITASLDVRWRITSELKHKFWKEWSQKYLHELQERGKWKTPSPNITEGMLMIIKEDNTPVLRWPLGRVSRVYKGDDGLVRVVDLKTVNGTFKRPIHRLAPLFNDSNVEYPEYEEATTAQNAKKRQHSCSSDSSKEGTRPKRQVVSYTSQGIFTTIMIALLFLPLVFTSSVKITNFKEEPGIYFENIGSAKLSSAHWTFMVFYDLTPMWSDMKTLDVGINTLIDLCIRPSLETSCAPILHHFKHTFNTLLQEEMLLTKKRQKRGALDIVGNMAHGLFGVLDSTYAEAMSKTIEDVKLNEEYLMNLLKNQTSIIDSTLNIIKVDEKATEMNFKKLQRSIYDDVNHIKNETVILRQSHQLTALVTQLSMITTNIQRTQAELIHALTQSHNRNISPLILTPQQLKQELQIIQTHLPSTRTLPADNENLLQFYKLMSVRSAVNEKHIMFLLELPLVDQEAYSLFKLTAIPTKLNESMVSIIPKTQFLAVNDHRDQYAMLTIEDLNTCTILMENTHICPNQQSRFGIEYPAFTCEIQLFNNKTGINCEFTKLHNNITFKALHQTNNWLFATMSDIELSAVCGNDISRQHLLGSGILTIEQNCVLKNNMIILQGHEQQSSQQLLSYASFGNISEVNTVTEVTIGKEHIEEFENQVNKLTNLQNQLIEIKGLPANLKPPAIHHQYISCVALLLSTIMILLFAAWRLRLHCQKNSSIKINPAKPEPMPRQHFSEV